MQYFRLPISIIFSFLIFSCSQEKPIKYDYPIVKISDKIAVNDTSAQFSATVENRNDLQIFDHGFEWKQVDNEFLDKVSNGLLQTSLFKSVVKRGLEINKNYIVRAFVKFGDNYVSYSDWVSFSKAGSLAPVISSIEPMFGSWSDTLIMKGENFAYNTDIIQIKFGDKPSRILIASDTLIKFIVPQELIEDIRSKIIVSVGSRSVEFGSEFELRSPEFTSMNPQTGGYDSLITINGHGFNTLSTYVKLDNKVIPLSLLNPKTIMFRVPKGISGGLINLEITSGPFKIFRENIFKRNFPDVREVIPEEGFYGDTVVLKGENFGSQFTDTQFSQNFIILEMSTNQVKLIIPPLNQKNVKFQITADFVTAVSTVGFKIREPIIESISPQNVIPGNTVTLKGDYFFPGIWGTTIMVGNEPATILSSSRREIKFSIPVTESYTPELNISVSQRTLSVKGMLKSAFTTIPKLPGINRRNSAHFSIGDNLFIIGGVTGFFDQDGLDRQVWRYNTISNTWVRKNDFPGIPRQGAFGFSDGEKAYMVGGSYPTSDEFWEYHSVNDTWTKKNNLPFYPVDMFKIGGRTYAFSLFTVANDIIVGPAIWVYNSLTDEWVGESVNSNFFVEYIQRCSMVINDKLYYIISQPSGDEVLEFNPETKTFDSKGKASISGNGDVYTFEHNGFGYAVTVRGIYKFDPIQNSWTSLGVKDSSTFSNLWLGAKPVKFFVNNKWYFGLFLYNRNARLDSNYYIYNTFYELNAEYLED
ncbi:MAG: hypothetical protein EBR30_19015 [Cytophagia bacterium]|nr:hypothetical protein [Cytophagia bacterium]